MWAKAEHLDANLVLANRLPDPARGRLGCPPDDEEDDGEEGKRQPVEVLRVDDADECVRQLRVVGAEPLLAVRPVVRILEREHVPRLGECERHHRERDAADPQAHVAEHVREHEREGDRERDSLPEAPVPLRDRDVRDVDTDRDVERVPEREQSREPELDVVGECERAEQEAGGEERQCARARERLVEELRDRYVELRHERQRDEDDERPEPVPDELAVDTVHARDPTTAPAKPRGRARRTSPSSSTTTRSPIPLDA